MLKYNVNDRVEIIKYNGTSLEVFDKGTIIGYENWKGRFEYYIQDDSEGLINKYQERDIIKEII